MGTSSAAVSATSGLHALGSAAMAAGSNSNGGNCASWHTCGTERVCLGCWEAFWGGPAGALPLPVSDGLDMPVQG